MKRRIGYLLKAYAATLLVFVIAKAVFMLVCREGHSYVAGDVLQVVSHGLSLDLSTSLYIVSVPFLLLMASVWTPGMKWLRWPLRCYWCVIALALSLAFVADMSLYPFWGFKLDASCLQYLETPTEAMASVTTGYLLLRLLALIVLAAVLTWCYWKVTDTLYADAKVQKAKGRPWFLRVGETMLYVALIPLIVIGIRGGLSESTTNIGQVYFSQNQFLNHSAVNPVFSFLASFEKTASNNTVYTFMDESQCREVIDSLYNTASIDSDTLLNNPRPNIIVVLLEGCGGTFTEIGGRSDVTPNLNRLSREGIYFSQCYANTWRTDRGTVCTWSGYPSFPTMSVMKMPAKSRTLPNMARTLKEQGYTTHYLYGGDINFTNMRSYLIGGGFETLKWKADYTEEEQQTSQWGVCDSITFESLYDMAATACEPFVIGYSTLSSHQPWDVPISHFDDEVLNAFYYLDQCLGRFVERFRQSDRWQNTLIVLLPDHGIPYEDIGEIHPLKNHIPMVWTGGAVKAARVIPQMCNQTDLPATLLGQMGISHDDYTFSRDVMSKTYTRPSAIHTYDDGYLVYDPQTFICYDFIGERVVNRGTLDVAVDSIHPGQDAWHHTVPWRQDTWHQNTPVSQQDEARLRQWAEAILQAASHDLDERGK